MPGHSNHLIHETSPYLLQHAHNPVDWYPWGEEALQRATSENKPILVSIGYAACHWCHVMERESFEDESTAAIMNSNFINIKIDREERPDLDHIYMDAVQAMTGSGGWPLNVFLTPEAKPFYGGTYFPPKRAFNRPSWQEILLSVVRSFKEKRNEIDQQAEGITGHLMQANDFGLQAGNDINEWGNADELLTNLMKNADKEWGGFGRAPKFPQTGSILYLLRYHYTHRSIGQKTYAEEAINQALLSINRMIQGGVYDQLGGGFARYSTDDEWLAPHFEKMLYDNALLLMVLSEAYQLTGIKVYEEVIHETMEFIRREMTFRHASGKIGFYSALDADSEGEEGKFYVWQRHEVDEILGEDAPIFCDYYDVTTWGNWEGKNILRVKVPLEEFCADKNIEAELFRKILDRCKNKLLKEREKKIRPSLDDKIILGWNALMNMACSKAFAATGNEAYRIAAIDNMEFLLANFNADGENELYHTWKNERAKFPAFLDDYAFLIQALIHLQEITGETKWLDKAVDFTTYVLDHFSEEGTGFFYYTPAGQPDVIIRKKEVYDGAVPSGNSVMATNLYRLALLTGRTSWKDQSFQMTGSLGKAIVRYPTSFANWGCLVQEMVSGTDEIVITGKKVDELHSELLKKYIPHRVLMVTSTVQNSYPLLAGKAVSEASQIWLCRNFMCLAPVATVKALISLIDSEDSAD